MSQRLNLEPSKIEILIFDVEKDYFAFVINCMKRERLSTKLVETINGDSYILAIYRPIYILHPELIKLYK